jgi:hypothetical protein
MGEKINICQVLVGKLKGIRSLIIPRRIWVCNIKMDLEEIIWNVLDWVILAMDREGWPLLVNEVMNVDHCQNGKVS